MGKWLLVGAGVLAVYLLFFQGAAGAAVLPSGGGGNAPPGIPSGQYTVTTTDTGPAGNLALRSTPSVDPTNANLVEWLPHGSKIQASGVVQNGFAAAMAPDQKTGWVSLNFITLG
jgi:hypothetical protein